MHLLKCILCFKDIEKDYERYLVQSKKKTTTSRSQIWSSMCTLYQSTFVGTKMVSSRREIICSRTWKNYQNQWESTTQQLWRKLALFSGWNSRKMRFTTYRTPTVRGIVHLPFSFRALDLFVASPLFIKGTMLCYKEKLLSISDVRGQVLFFGSLQGPLVLVRGWKIWSCDNIFATLRLAKHWSRDAACLMFFPPLSKSRGRKDVLCTRSYRRLQVFTPSGQLRGLV